MAPFRWRSIFSKIGLEFWLALPLVGGLFWFMPQWLNQQILSQAYPAATQLDIKNQQQVEVSFTLTVLSVDAEIDRRAGDTEVTVRAAGSSLKELEFEYPVTEYEEIVQAIAEELGLPPDAIRPLIRYRVD
jgi:hypothetical protein